MRQCDPNQLTLKPFTKGEIAVAVGEDGRAIAAALGGAGMVGKHPVLTLYLPSPWPAEARELSVNLLPAGRRWDSDSGGTRGPGLNLESGQVIRSPRVAEARLAFEGRVLGGGTMTGVEGFPHVLLVEVLAAFQRWPRGCAIT
jgi:hypothetical protein